MCNKFETCCYLASPLPELMWGGERGSTGGQTEELDSRANGEDEEEKYERRAAANPKAFVSK